MPNSIDGGEWMTEARYAPVKERPLGPIKTYDETEVLKSSNTWEFLIFEQLRAVRFIQQNLFSEPRNVRFHILNLLSSMNHLESMLYDRINPNYEGNTDTWFEYQRRKPSIFKNMHKNMDRISTMINSNELTQFQLAAEAEIWFRALDKSLNSIKRISPTVYEMKLPDTMDTNFEQIEESPVGPDVSAPVPNLDTLNERGDNDSSAEL
jgi:hypothetical protein